MRRSIYQSLLNWKADVNRKPLILEGARQVGKTYILKEFGKREYDNLVYINCRKNDYMSSFFQQDFDIQRILRGLSAYSNEEIVPQKTLIFLDEVQDSPNCLESLKYFCEEAREYHIVVAGSLLGLIDHKDESFPVGKVNTLNLYPMSFEEFLWAMGEDKIADLIDSCDWFLINALDTKIQNLLRQYYYVGGMPEAVFSYVNENNLQKVREIQHNILDAYDSDFSKHAGNEAVRVRMVWNSLPSQLAKENKKFVYGAMKKGARAKEFEKAIQWIVDAGLAYKIHRCTTPTMPLSFYEDNSSFKLYMNDVGLLGAMANMPAKYMLIDNNVFVEAKGAFAENYVLQQIMNRGRRDFSVFYFSKESSTLEIDFLLQDDERVIPIEVKAEENVKSKSLRTFINEEYSDKQMKGLRCSMKPYIDQGWFENVPLHSIGGYLSNL